MRIRKSFIKLKEIFVFQIPKLLIQKESLKLQTIISVSLRIGNRFIAFLITWWLANFLGPNELGIYSYALSIVMILSVIAEFGMPALAMREAAQGKALSDWGRVKGVLVWSLSLSFGVALILIIISAIVFPLFTSYLENLSISTLYIGIIMLPFLALNSIVAGVLRALGKMFEGLLLIDTLRGTFFFVLLLLFSSTFLPTFSIVLDASEVMVTHSGAAIITCIVGFMLLRRAWPEEAKGAIPKYLTSSWRKLLVPFAALGGMAVLNNNIDILMLGVLSNPSEVGYFKIAMQFSILVSFGLTAVRLVIAPRFSNYFTKKDNLGLKKSAQMATRAAITFALPVSLLFVFGGRLLIATIFDERYLAAYLPLVILTVGQLANSIVGPVGVLLSMTSYERDAAMYILITLAINFFLNLVLIPDWGTLGAAIATVISKMLLNGILWLKVKQRFGFFLHPFKIT